MYIKASNSVTVTRSFDSFLIIIRWLVVKILERDKNLLSSCPVPQSKYSRIKNEETVSTTHLVQS